MRIKVLSVIAGPDINAHPGDILDVDDDFAVSLIDGSFAVPIKSQTVETAIVSGGEETAAPQAKKKYK